MAEGKRNDLHLTSTGRGHAFRNALQFPPLDFKRTVEKTLPDSLTKQSVRDFYITTTGSTHNYKPSNTSLQNDLYKRAPGHWHVKYNEDTIKKLQVKPQRKQLTMGNQSSEVKSQYTGREGIPMKTTFSSGIQPPVYKDHHTQGPLKSLVPSTQNTILKGEKYNIKDRGVFSYHGDIYLTTTQKDHRRFNRGELEKYPKKEYATYWECEGYPKAWGHGSDKNPLPPESVQREKGPMRDQIWFRTATTVPRLPKSLEPVPNRDILEIGLPVVRACVVLAGLFVKWPRGALKNSCLADVHLIFSSCSKAFGNGMCSEVSTNYKDIPINKRHELFQPSAPNPWDIKSPGKDEIYSVPKMYETEYESIGSGRLVFV